MYSDLMLSGEKDHEQYQTIPGAFAALHGYDGLTGS
jgi:hypothetical protein